MQHSEFTLVAPDGASLAYRLWIPQAGAKAIVCLIHGLGEHTGRYAQVAATLGNAGYALLGFDQRGHGKTPGTRGVTPSFDTLLGDVQRVVDAASERFSGKPCFLYGHSMGGAWVLNFAIRRRPTLAGVIATSPLLRTAFKPPAMKLAAGKLLYRVAPNTALPNGLNLAAISRDPEVVAAYREDPLVHDKMSARLGLDLVTHGEWALAHANDFPPLPLLLVHGTADQITSPQATREFASKVKGDCTLKLWPGCYHETHNEPEREAVLQFMCNWLDTQVEGQRSGKQENAATLSSAG